MTLTCGNFSAKFGEACWWLAVAVAVCCSAAGVSSAGAMHVRAGEVPGCANRRRQVQNGRAENAYFCQGKKTFVSNSCHPSLPILSHNNNDNGPTTTTTTTTTTAALPPPSNTHGINTNLYSLCFQLFSPKAFCCCNNAIVVLTLCSWPLTDWRCHWQDDLFSVHQAVRLDQTREWEGARENDSRSFEWLQSVSSRCCWM